MSGGKFRANPSASDFNNLRIVSEDTPGTPATDTLTIDTTAFTGGEVISGIKYTGKDGVATVIDFSKQQIPDGQKIKETYTLPALTAGFEGEEGDLKDMIFNLIQRHEVGAIVTVTYTDASNELVVVHTGSGTLAKLIIDEAEVGTNVRA